MSQLLFRYWTLDIRILGLYSECHCCFFGIGHWTFVYEVCTANVTVTFSVLDIGHSFTRFVQRMSQLLFRYWTLDIRILSLYSECHCCFFGIGHWTFVYYRFVQRMSQLLFRYWTLDIHQGLYSEFLSCTLVTLPLTRDWYQWCTHPMGKVGDRVVIPV